MGKEDLFGDLYIENVKAMSNEYREKCLGILLEQMTCEQIADQIKLIKLSGEVEQIRMFLLARIY